jgi:hypothetical protein
MTEMFCKDCFFWSKHSRQIDGYCHRHAPIATQADGDLHEISIAIKLLLWWSVREWGGDPDKQLEDYMIALDKSYKFTCWPVTDEHDWCGEWKARANERQAAA